MCVAQKALTSNNKLKKAKTFIVRCLQHIVITYNKTKCM